MSTAPQRNPVAVGAARLRELQRSSQRAAWASLVGLLVVLVALLIGGRSLSRVQAQLRSERDALLAAQQQSASARSEAEKAAQEAQQARMDRDRLIAERSDAEKWVSETKARLAQVNSALQEAQQALAAAQAEQKSLEEQFEIAGGVPIDTAAALAKHLDKATLKKLPLQIVLQPRASVQQLGEKRYQFDLWVDAPAGRLDEIAKVRYVYNHPSFGAGNNSQESSDRASKFKAGYTGWGTLRRVIVTVTPKQGAEFSIAFDMAEAVQAQMRDVPTKENIPLPKTRDAPRREP